MKYAHLSPKHKSRAIQLANTIFGGTPKTARKQQSGQKMSQKTGNVLSDVFSKYIYKQKDIDKTKAHRLIG